MERSREILTLSVFGLAASFGAIVLWKSLKRPSVSESPRGLSIQRASVRTSATRTIAFDDADSQTVVEEAPTILNALYMYSQDSAKQGTNITVTGQMRMFIDQSLVITALFLQSEVSDINVPIVLILIYVLYARIRIFMKETTFL